MTDGNPGAGFPDDADPSKARIERYQATAAELVMEDEAWRDGLTDEAATPLLDWALEWTDRCLARAARRTTGASAGDTSAAEQESWLEELAYEAAHQVRGVLSAIGGIWRGEAEDDVWARLEPLLGPPLFATPDEARTAIGEALARAGRPVDRPVGRLPGETETAS